MTIAVVIKVLNPIEDIKKLPIKLEIIVPRVLIKGKVDDKVIETENLS